MEEDPDTPTAVTSSESVSPAPHSTFTKIQVLFSSRRKITLEPILFLFNVASYVVWVTAQDLMVRKSCLVNYGYPESSCDDLNSNESLQTEIHSMVSDFLMWKSILEASLKVVAVPILGWWSDRVGTKWPLVFCLSCLALESSFLLLNTLMTSWPLEFVLISAIFYGFSGGVHGLLMLAFSLMAKTTSTGSRTLRMGILDGFYYLGSPIGLLLAPLIFQSAGYVGIFTGAVGVYGLAIAYVFLRITHEEGARLPQVSNTDTAQEEEDGTFLCGLDRFAISFWSTFKKRRNADRSHILVCVLAMLLDSFVIWGEANVKYLFVQKAFDWSYSKYSLFSSLSSLITVVGALLIVPLITIKTSFSDSVIGLTGAVSRVVERVFYSLASRTPTLSWLMYVGCLAGVGSPLVPIAIRSLISKIAEEDTDISLYSDE